MPPVFVRGAVFALFVSSLVVFAQACGTEVQADTCGPGNCEGCCDGEGRCKLGQEVTACGAAGQACAVCAENQSCEAAACVGPAAPVETCTDDGTPQGLSDFAFGFDPVGKDLVVFGGDPGVPNNCTPNPMFSGETWFFSPSCGTWRKSGENSPSARARHVAAFDTKRRRLVIFGGRHRAGTTGAYTVYNDAHALNLGVNGTDAHYWEPLTPAGTPPPALSSSAAVYDAAGDRMLIFGGNTSTSGATFAPNAQLFALSFGTNTWAELVPANGVRPPARLFHAAAMDAKRNRLVIYSGGDANAFVGPFLTDAWAFDLTTFTWSELTLSGTKPIGRIRPALVEDPERDRLLMFGGHDDGAMGERNDLWAMDFSTNAWVQLRAGDVFKTAGSGFCDFPSDFTEPDLASPERREAVAFTYAPGAGHLMFGGRSDCGVLQDVWALDAASAGWEMLEPSFSGLSCQRSGKTNCTKLCF